MGANGGLVFDANPESLIYEEFYCSRNFGSALHKFGFMLGGAFNYIDQNILNGKIPVTVRDNHEDHAQRKPAADYQKTEYPKSDGVLSFDKLSSVFLSNTNHEEDQSCHLVFKDPDLPSVITLQAFEESAQCYCPAGGYEVVEDKNQKRLQISSQNMRYKRSFSEY